MARQLSSPTAGQMMVILMKVRLFGVVLSGCSAVASVAGQKHAA